ncbi:MAG: MerC domain-containing protein [Hyphomonadaceae bacterium]|nr:MerC domain-containing protein [Hyphomonadaceae bacterium]
MAGRTSGAAVIDGSAITLSSLCLIHCLFLPLISAALPIAGAWAEAEWLHKAFVAAALPFSLTALMTRKIEVGAATMIMIGFALLACGAFVEAWHDYETALIVAGGLILAAGHAWRFVQVNQRGH